ncbi:MAG: rhodanese-related sulfurtransferase [Microcystis sp. M015S2]|uniref:rhodanese-like domain-containing protein n=1 Tax=unclassified Microcystis TaxID=2643300 RepID=UPI00258C8FB5|nr:MULTISPECIES: rhodanese-like domain-containing protein [unclassified Microcystis]MCA2655501.1 rhodanese-related sulfurtransferase [Microcystis sp. M061S2]MCA2708223.1 rhodanese-related sulfurtransferase [Microcystis sp. M025S2]MCA2741437.1 rhodanese-related sulfurtransferase [Microcystis sp. M015S2]MCA2759684.1 rhodanese-related sulfurtransferase [Microcystis sp. M145S2]
MSIPEISVDELALRLAAHDPNLQLIDVREPEEVAIASVASFTILPLSQYREWSPTIATQFNPQAETLVICHHGMRSLQMCQWLQSQGFTNVKNINGGIDAYSLLVDPNIPRY